MPDYKKMYLTLLQAQTEAIELLQKAAQKAEDIYISSENISILKDIPSHRSPVNKR